MGNKYIIDLNPDCVEGEYLRIPARIAGEEQWLVTKAALTPYTEPDLDAIKQEEYEKGYKTAKVQCNIQAEKDLREVGERHYQKGLSDAWEATKKIFLPVDRGGLPASAIIQIFGNNPIEYILKDYSASEAIEKIRQYEQGKEITKGDVVRMKSVPEIEILVTCADGDYVSGIALTEMDDNCEIGDQYTDIRIHKVEKTGRHYDIAEVLRKIREDSNG